MQNFDYQTPTRLIFGKGIVAEKLASVMSQYGKNVLITFGGGSIKRSGLYDQVKEILKDKNIFELSGIAPNPKFNPSVIDGVKICHEKNIDVILAVGGGSVLDCTKAIAGCAKTTEGTTPTVEELWDIITYKTPTTGSIPIVDIMTMAATGSEYDSGAVISRTETEDKVCYVIPVNTPAVSFLDPTYTFTVPVRQTLAGVADCMNHILEQYFCPDHIMINDAFMEGGMKTLVKNVKTVLKNPEDYDARAEIFYTCTLACNGIYSLGNSPAPWVMHSIEHALSAYYDITHGIGLAIITPRWMKYILEYSKGELHEQVKERILSVGKNVFGVSGTDEGACAEPVECIEAFYDFFCEIGIPMTLPEVGIDDSRLPEIAHHIALEGHEDHWAPLHESDILAILKACLVKM